jgi:hypothetical protein
MSTSTWAARETLASVLAPTDAGGLLQMPATGDVAVPLATEELAQVVQLSAEHLAAAGIRPADRVVVALNNDGVGVGTITALAATATARAAVSVGPRGRMRLLRSIKGSGATALVVTPTGAMDLLARLHIEFLVDPLELGIERVVLVGEIPSPSCERQLAMELGAEVGTVFADPFFGALVGHRSDDRLVTSPDHVALAPLGEDVVVTGTEPGEAYELVLRPTWSQALDAAHLRTGWVTLDPTLHPEAGESDAAASAGSLPWPTATVGDRVLARGQWLSVQALTSALRLIDGIEAWGLEVRRDGTLDKVILQVAFSRPSLTENKMWAGRLREAMNTLTPIDVEVGVVDDPADITERLVDRRGHHLGIDRLAVKRTDPVR